MTGAVEGLQGRTVHVAVRQVLPLAAWPRSRRSKAPTTPPPLRARCLRRRVRSTFSSKGWLRSTFISKCWLRRPRLRSLPSSSLEDFNSSRQRFLRSSAAMLHSHLPPTSRRSWRPSPKSTVASPLRSLRSTLGPRGCRLHRQWKHGSVSQSLRPRRQGWQRDEGVRHQARAARRSAPPGWTASQPPKVGDSWGMPTRTFGTT